jgi:hypothetical protein
MTENKKYDQHNYTLQLFFLAVVQVTPYSTHDSFPFVDRTCVVKIQASKVYQNEYTFSIISISFLFILKLLLSHLRGKEMKLLKDMTPEELNEVCERVREWVDSPDGQEALQKSLAKAQKMAEAFEKASRIDPKILDISMTF